MISDIEAAANVYWGVFTDPTEIPPHNDTPEEILLAKELFSNLSKEATEVLEIILAAPDELFLDSGKLSWMALKKSLRSRRWSWKRILYAQREIQKFCRTF